MNKVFGFFCTIAGVDRQLAVHMPDRERQATVIDALRLMIMSAILFGVWTLALKSLGWPLLGALIAAAMIAGIVILFDRDILANDWKLVGILADQVEQDHKDWLRVVLRVAFALVVSLVTAYGMTLFLFSGRIEQGLQADRTVANQPLMDAAQTQIAATRETMLGTLSREIGSLGREREVQLELAQDKKQKADEAARQMVVADQEWQNELGGRKGKIKGDGPRAKYAKQIRDTAAAELERLEAGSQEATQRLTAIDTLLAARRQELAVAQQAVVAEEQRILTALQQDPRWQPERGDLLSRFNMLETLKSSPKEGRSVRKVYYGTVLFLLALELFVLLSKFSRAPSTYRLKLITHTREEALRIRLEHEATIAQMLGGSAKADLQIRPSDRA